MQPLSKYVSGTRITKKRAKPSFERRKKDRLTLHVFAALAKITALVIEHRPGLTRPVFIYERVKDMGEKDNAQRCKFNEDVSGLTMVELGSFLEQNAKEMITVALPFAAYMRRKLREKGLLQQDVFLAADLSEGFGYKLIAEEKRTRQRDVILRLCLAAQFRPEEVQEALLRYGMAPLWWRFPRDAVLLAAFGSGVYELEKVNVLLEQYGQKPLVKGYE